MSTFAEAITALIDQQDQGYSTRDVVAASDKNVRIANDVFGEQGVGDEFYNDPEVEDAFGTFENCREYGLTVTYGGWTFAAFEHRISDDICVEGCPADEVKEYGPYGSGDKHDVLFSTKWKQYHEAADALVKAMKYVKANPSATRAQLKKEMQKK